MLSEARIPAQLLAPHELSLSWSVPIVGANQVAHSSSSPNSRIAIRRRAEMESNYRSEIMLPISHCFFIFFQSFLSKCRRNGELPLKSVIFNNKMAQLI